jgi:hypothetical protein
MGDFPDSVRSQIVPPHRFEQDYPINPFAGILVTPTAALAAKYASLPKSFPN